jgi:hypothetical protein
MLPSLAELRARSRFYRDAARDATDAETKHRRVDCAFVFAQVAQVIEGDEHRAHANAGQLARMLAEVLTAARGASNFLRTEAVAATERAISDERAGIGAWRIRAEKLRATADQFTVPSAQESLRRVAADYDESAKNVEAMSEGRLSPPGAKTR